MGGEGVILLVEDNPADAELVLLSLESAALGARIDVVRDGAEALDYLFCRGAWRGRDAVGPPRLVLLDLKLPKVDGLEVLRQVKADARTRAIPVVLLTSSSVDRDVVEGYRLGVNSYVQKPLEFETFRDAVASIGRYWIDVNLGAPGLAFVAEPG